MTTLTSLRSLNYLSSIFLDCCSSKATLELHFNEKQVKKKRFNWPSPSYKLRLAPLCSAAANDNGSSLLVGAGEAVSHISNDNFFQVVLVSPQIPGNTGSIARTCAASAVKLHLVGPLGFQVDDSKLKRAGMDYWPFVVVKVHESWTDFMTYFKNQKGNKRLLAFTKRGVHTHSSFSYEKGDYLIFGSETSGLPPEALQDCSSELAGGGTIRIPMVEAYVRCLNLAVSVGIAVYEAARQLNYEQLKRPTVENYVISREDIFA